MNAGSVDFSGHGLVTYRIVVRGGVTERLAEALEGVVVETVGAESVLRVDDADQAKLQAILSWLYGHGAELVSVRSA